MTKKTRDEIKKVSEEITARTLEAIGRALQRASSGPTPAPGYGCQGQEFKCKKKYTCEAPDYCDNDFDCSGEYTPARTKQQRKDCHYTSYSCTGKTFACAQKENFQCGVKFTCENDFTG